MHKSLPSKLVWGAIFFKLMGAYYWGDILSWGTIALRGFKIGDLWFGGFCKKVVCGALLTGYPFFSLLLKIPFIRTVALKALISQFDLKYVSLEL